MAGVRRGRALFETEHRKVVEDIKGYADRMKKLIQAVEKLAKRLSSKDISVSAIVEAQNSLFELKEYNLEVRSLPIGMYYAVKNKFYCYYQLILM